MFRAKIKQEIAKLESIREKLIDKLVEANDSNKVQAQIDFSIKIAEVSTRILALKELIK